ncbi:MAG TPA: peptide chain release factor N(5)-glutamine methyltransferase [Gemmatimonadales bacterium]|nr:peptide chain release factor N(5)-glutamine methyltransferase [Gemmatimonadales bacterium]
MSEATLFRRQALGEAAERLAAAGIPGAGREALRIWQDLIDPHAPVGADYLKDSVGPASEAFERAIHRRLAGEPLAHVTGWAGFRRLTLRCDRRALIPRPETEGLVDLLLERAAGGRVADLGTGSGCLALALSDEGTYDEVIGVEWSEEALALARENQALTGLPVRFVQGNWSGLPGEGELDTIVSNPPYLTDAEYESLDTSVKAWEPREALASGPDGLLASREVLEVSARALKPGGWLAMECDSTRASILAGLAEQAGWLEVTVHDDLFGRARYLLARRSAA